MSFSIQLTSGNIYSGSATNDLTYLFNFNNVSIKDGPYKLTWSFNAVGVGALVTNPSLNLDIGSTNGKMFFAGTTNNNIVKKQSIGTIFYERYMTGALDFQYKCDLTSNPPVIFESINQSSNYIRVYMTIPTTETLIGPVNVTGPYVLNLYFEKI